MEQKIKEIVATFIKVPAANIGPATPVDRSAVQSSILLHRMYARLAEEGVVVENYAAVKVFGDLYGQVNGHHADGSVVEGLPVQRLDIPVVLSAEYSAGALTAGVGLDIEEIAAFPRTNDFRREEFYKMNFTAEETAYCILQADPYSSFAGLFSAKEAIVKAGGARREKNFNTIEITHTAEGKPLYPGYAISVSHAGGMAAAVAVRDTVTLPAQPQTMPSLSPGKKTASPLGWIAVLLSIIALVIALLH
jgi:phosphopantetheine--protein transferase-like protein